MTTEKEEQKIEKLAEKIKKLKIKKATWSYNKRERIGKIELEG